VLDRVMPFVANLACGGKNWRDQSVSRSQVLKVSDPIQRYAPDIFSWMAERMDECVQKGWLRDA
jgi:putative hydrolase of HD superfamily